MRRTIYLLVLISFGLLTGCSSAQKKIPPTAKPAPATGTSATPTSLTKPGGYYQDDGPGVDAAKNTPAYLDSIIDAIPRTEKFHSGANRPYTVFGRSYVPVVNNEPFRQSGIASWYGRKFHGNTTSIGEIYDMYAMTAAHPTLPLPSYVRVTNPANNKSIVVRVNDRGPFHEARVIDLSYAAAYRLDIVRRGSAPVLVERMFAGEVAASKPPMLPTPAVIAATPPVLAANSPTTSSTNSPTTTPTNAPTTSPITPDGTQLFLQLGAFATQENANIFRARMARELDWNREPLVVVFLGGLWRVRMGPYNTRTEAEAIQARVKESHDFSPVIAKP